MKRAAEHPEEFRPCGFILHKEYCAIKLFEAAGGGTSKKQGYKSINASTEFQVACVTEVQ